MNNKTILVVDDEQNVRQLICKVLEKEGFTVLTACNGSEGLEIFHKNSIDLIISDIKMPEMSGIEFLHRVKEEEPGIGFILITAFATTETAIDAIRSGAQDY
ncbi:MAG: response regulator, partial [Clostridia bacterium]